MYFSGVTNICFCNGRLGRRKILMSQLGFSFSMLVIGLLSVSQMQKLTLCIHASIFTMHFIIHAVHLGRDKIVDFHWNSSDPWTIVSVSDDGESTGGGGTLQVHLFLAILQRKININLYFHSSLELLNLLVIALYSYCFVCADMAHE